MFNKSQACRLLPAAGGKDLDGSNFLFRKTVWQVFNPNHRLFQKKFYVILLTSKSKLHTSGRPCYPGHITDTIPPVSSARSPLPPNTTPKREALIGKPEGGRNLDLADGRSYRGCPRVTTLTGMLTVFELTWMEPPARSGHMCRTLHPGQTL